LGNYAEHTKKLHGKMKRLLFSNKKYTAYTQGCAVSGPYSDVLVLTATDTEGHVPGG
jgi:hypothetical protein